MKRIIYILGIVILVNIIVTNSGAIREKSRYDISAIPYILETGQSGTFYTGTPEKDANFIGRISFIPYMMPNNGTVNIIACEDWKGKPDAYYVPDDFCGASVYNDSYTVYAYPIIVQVPVDKINGNISLYSVVEVKGYLLPEMFYVSTGYWGILTDPIVYADSVNIISEDEAQKL